MNTVLFATRSHVRQVRGGSTPDQVPLYAMCRLWVQNSIDADCGPRPGHPVR